MVIWWLRAGIENDLGCLLGSLEVGAVPKEISRVGALD